MDPGTAINAEHISKSFLIPHEIRDTFRERIIRFKRKRNYEVFEALKDVSFAIQPHTKTAIIGPTAAGKTQILYLLTNMISPT